MIPSIVARQVRATILDYLRTTFALSDGSTEEALFTFLESEGGLFRGPYLDLRLSFRTAVKKDQLPLTIAPPFTPFRHQERAFQRLYSTGGHQPQHTLVTTGTGSGKTECFLYPILDHCWRARGQPGIKAIILYPMNALAADQARRLASLLWNDDRLRGKVSAGLYVGGSGDHAVADEDHLIDKRDVLRASPPDILLTNYKMLDFLLLRPDDRRLWEQNRPESLRYLVLDELHTYDGAQGSDVACLIRRLKHRLATAPGFPCCIGTSATIGGKAQDETARALTDFATEVFGEDFYDDSLIVEDRLTPEETYSEPATLDLLPPAGALGDLDAENFTSAQDWLQVQAKMWTGLEGERLDPVALGARLSQHAFLRRLLKVLGGKLKSLDEVDTALVARMPEWEERPIEERRLLLDSFLGLVSAARTQAGPSAEPRPFLSVQVQMWCRELRHLLRKVEAPDSGIHFAWGNDLAMRSDETSGKWLPIIRCRDCGASGLGSLQRSGDSKLLTELSDIGRAWLNRNTSARYVAFGHGQDPASMPTHLCPACLAIGFEQRCSCGAGQPSATMPIRLEDRSSDGVPPRFLQACPECDSEGSLMTLGSRAPSLLSVAISHLFLSEFNEDKKLLAFTDSVQDASHRAGFFGARTYRFNLRTAFQGILEATADDIRLPQLGEGLLPFWSSRLPSGEPKVIATLLPADLRELPAYVSFRESGGSGTHAELKRLLKVRLGWEAVMEFGLSARAGRTLENTRCATTRIDADRLDEALKILQLELAERISLESLSGKAIDPAALRHWVVGILDRLRVRGGIWHPLLKGYCESGGKNFLLSKHKQPLLSPFGRNSITPKFLHDLPAHSGKADSVFDAIRSSIESQTWFRDWASRALGIHRRDSGLNELMAETVRRLVQAKILKAQELSKGSGSVYGIDPEALLVTRSVSEMTCELCSGHFPVAQQEAGAFAGMACPRYRCKGMLKISSQLPETYYGRIYRSGRLERIFSEEHTGILDRARREQVEEAFKRESNPGDPNLLVCTPTLEMGIDIGDLSATVLCSVPPTTANFLQRVGRAGRTTGNALCLTLANHRPHDLYFHASPMEMMAGLVLPPGCFLDAPEMLRRQFVAFAMDSWARQEEVVKRIPQKAKFVLGQGAAAFPGRFLDYYRANRATLLAAFLEAFAGVVTEKNRVRLSQFGSGELVPEAVKKAFDELAAEIEDLKSLQKKALKRIQDIDSSAIEVDDPDAERSEAEASRQIISRLREELGRKYPLNVLTDAGVLPNYAFPEPGVTLRSVIGEDAGGGKKRYEAYEYVRPASSAIREFAPFNTFYAEGRRVRVDEVDLGTTGKPMVERWRLCPSCAHMERVMEGAAALLTCPRCQNDGWVDAGQVREILHFRRSRSLASRLEASTVDDGDDRDEEFYDTADLIDVGPDNHAGARVIESLPFGYELLTGLTLREMNFGPVDQAPSMRIAGRDVAGAGFSVCADCGKVQSRHKKQGQDSNHAFTCRARKNANQERIHELFLYREVTSEAIRILLPVAAVDLDRNRVSFKAAIELGFRRHFRGNPGHLQIRYAEEPLIGGGSRNYLVIFDAVPGGTGYLSELWQENNFMAILKAAQLALASCSCRTNPERDGCYQCVYAYQNQRSLSIISRRAALSTLESILAEEANIQDCDTLSDVSIEDRMESELETKFLNALRLHAQRTGKATWSESLHQGEKRWRLGIGDQTWEVRAQQRVGASQGVSEQSRPDFIIETLHRNPDIRKIAVFCDGYRYHACPGAEDSRLADDVQKRQSLIDSGNFLVWSVTWKDVQAMEEGLKAYQAPSLFSGMDERKLGPLLKAAGCTLDRTARSQSGMEQLWSFLSAPDSETWRRYAHALIVGWIASDSNCTAAEGNRLEDWIQHDQRPLHPVATKASGTESVLSRFRSAGWLDVLARIKASDVSSRDLHRGRIYLRLADSPTSRRASNFEDSWRTFLQAWNALQFAERVTCLTTEGATPEPAKGVLASGAQRAADAPSPKSIEYSGPSADALSDLLELTTDRTKELVQAVADSGLPLPSCEVVVKAKNRKLDIELAWEKQRIAVLGGEQVELAPDLTALGWTVFSCPFDLDAILQALNERTGSTDQSKQGDS